MIAKVKTQKTNLVLDGTRQTSQPLQETSPPNARIRYLTDFCNVGELPIIRPLLALPGDLQCRRMRSDQGGPVRIYNCHKIVVLLSLVAEFGCHRSAQYYLDLGNRLYAEGKFDEASINHRKSIASNSQGAEAHYKLALDELKLGQQAEAYNEFTRATKLAPTRDDIAVAFADFALVAYSADPRKPKLLYDQISGTANRLLRKDKNSFDGLRLSADVLVLDGKLEEALPVYRKAEAIQPLDPKVTFPMVQVLFRLNQGMEGEQLAQKSIQAHRAEAAPLYDVLFNYYVQSNRPVDAENLLRARIAALPKDADARLQLASFYHGRKRDPEMAQVINAMLGNSGDFPQGHALAGDFYANIGRLDDAVREYTAGLRSNSKDKTLYQKRIVKSVIAQGKRDQAIERLNADLKDNPDDLDTRAERAILLRETNDPRKLELATSEMNAILEKEPNNAVVRYNLGLAYLAKGDKKSGRAQLSESARLAPRYLPPRLALAELAQETRNYSDTIRMADEILAVDPANADAKLWHAAGLLGNRDYQQAGTELDALLREHPDNLIANLHMAALETDQKKYKDAEARYLRLYKPGQSDLRPLEGLIQLYAGQQQLEKALKLLDEELKLAPESRSVHLLVASTAMRAGKLDLAAQHYEWVRSNDPKSVEAYTALGNIYRLRGDLSSALTSYQKAAELAPNNAVIMDSIAFLETASGQHTQAIASLRKQLAINPEDTTAQNNLAFELAESGTDLDQASALAEKAQRKAPNNPGIADTLSWVYVRKGLNDSAIQILNGLVKRYPDAPALRYHLGVALLQKGKLEEAKTQFSMALSHNPPKDMADKIKEIMSKIS
jgi:tetratricopeptide (TPR) repeat protein